MTSVVLLEQLKAFTEKIMADMILPVAMQQGDTEQAYRAPEVYLMRLPDSRAAKKKAPTSSTGSFRWQRNSSPAARSARSFPCALFSAATTRTSRRATLHS